MDYDAKITSLALILPSPPKPVGSYLPVMKYGGKAYLSGQLAKTANGDVLTGHVGDDVTLQQAQEAARWAALNVISAIKHEITFEKFERILKVVGYVQTAKHFFDIPQVLNAASDLFFDVFGEFGRHARSAVGNSSLPLNTIVELEVELAVRS